MNNRIKQTTFKIFAVFALLFFTSFYAFPYILGNGSGGTYCDGDNRSSCDEKAARTLYSIESLVEEGGGYFLLSNSYISSISYMIEMSNLDGIGYDKLKVSVASALDNIILAEYTYDLLIEAASETPYDPVKIELLRNFDYTSLMKEMSLNSEIFQEVSAYLQAGDVTGTFRYIRENFSKMEKLLMSIKYYVETGKMPAISVIWQLNEVTAKTLLLGQYAAYIYDKLSFNN